MNKILQVITCLAFVLVVGCNGDNGKDPERPQQGDEKSAEDKSNKTRFPAVGPYEFECIKENFKDQFRLIGGTAIDVPSIRLSVDDYLGAYRNCTCAVADPMDLRSVTVHYGLVDNDFTVALEFSCLRYVRSMSSYDMVSSCAYLIHNNGTWNPATDLSAWEAANGPGYNYLNRVEVKDRFTGSPYRGLDPPVQGQVTRDALKIAFPHETELDLLIKHNSLAGTDQLEIIPVAEAKASGGTAIQQGIAWVPVGATLNEGTHGTEVFKNKAADLGSPCPSHCPPSMKFETTGLYGCR